MDAYDVVERELDAAVEQARSVVDNAPARLFTVRPALTHWSAAECLAHLSISTEVFLPVLRKAIDDGHSRHLVAKGVPRMDMLGRILRWFLEPPVRKRVKTTPAFVPRSVRAKSEALAEFATLQNQLKDLLKSARDLPLSKVKIVSPFDRRVKYNLYSAFLIIAAHQRRHLWQAEQAINELKNANRAA